jgi:hypothetical protein
MQSSSWLRSVVAEAPHGIDVVSAARECNESRTMMPQTFIRCKADGLIVAFGDSGSLQHHSYERVEGEKLENPY